MPAVGTLGADKWPGLVKLIEECGEVQRVAAKLLAFPEGIIPGEDTDWALELLDELADVKAAIEFVMLRNGLPRMRMQRRLMEKLNQFEEWHAIEATRIP